MLYFIAIIIILACILLTLVVLIQNPKGGGIAANFMAPNQIMGVKRSTDVVEKATWILAGTLIGLSLLSNFFRPSSDAEADVKGSQSELLENFDGTEAPTSLPSAPENTQQSPSAEPTNQTPVEQTPNPNQTNP